jgi:hypothetical protein
MIETNYQVSCDNCESEGRQPTIMHSQQELGEVTLRTFILYLKSKGWARGVSGDVCPLCVRSLSAERPQRSAKEGKA